jgi:hypothetical protein
MRQPTSHDQGNRFDRPDNRAARCRAGHQTSFEKAAANRALLGAIEEELD